MIDRGDSLPIPYHFYQFLGIGTLMLSNQNIYYVYKHTFSNGTCYIGKGKGKRAYQLTYRNKFWVSLSLKHGIPIISLLHQSLNEDDSFAKEVHEIATHKDNGVELCNFSCGGEGKANTTTSESTKKKLSDIAKKRGMPRSVIESAIRANLGSKHTVEHRAKISAGNMGKKLSEYQKQRLRECNLGKKHSDETKLRISIAKMGSVPPNKGVPCSEAQKQKLRDANLGKKNGPYNKAIYLFKHINHEDIACTMHYLYNKYDLPTKGISAIINLSKKTYLGWSVSKEAMPLSFKQ